MRLDIRDEKFILVAPRKYYRDLISYFQNNKLVNFKFYTKEEILSNYYGAYDINAIIFAMNKYDISYDNAKLLLENINIKKIDDNSKIIHLLELKEELDKLGLLYRNIYLPVELKSKPIYVIGYGNIDKELENIFQSLNVAARYIDFEKGDYLPNVLEFNSIDEEIFHFFNTICDLILSGVKQSDIVLVADEKKYAFAINKMCQQFNLPKLMPTTYNYLSLPNVLNIIKQIEVTGINDFLYHNEFSDDEDINNIKSIIENNKIGEIKRVDKQIDALKNILKNINVHTSENSFITHVDKLGLTFEDKYYFILGFNQGVYPIIRKDDDYLMNKEKDILGISTSFDVNNVSKKESIDILTNLKHAYVSYPLSNSGEKLYPSSLINELNLKVDKSNSKTIYSDKEGKKIFAKLEDLKRKFDIDSDERHSYSKLFDIPYMTYSNSFNNLTNYVGKNSRNYSYSNIKTFFQCQFRYYLQNILHLDEYETTFSQNLGLLCHEVLSKVYDNNFDFENEFNKTQEKYSFEIKDKVVLMRKKEELKVLCDILQEQKSYMNLKEVILEKKFVTKLNENVSINGFIDKIMITSDGKSDYYSIIDYKTGSETFTKKEVPYGFSMQLPTYALLLKEDEMFKDKELIGFYIQNILANEVSIPEDNYLFYRNLYRLVGESTGDLEKIKTFDTSYEKSLFIKSYSYNPNSNKYGQYTRYNSKEDFDKLINVTKENYLKADELIQKGDFRINPKILGSDQNSQCKYCPFGDICNVKESDYESISLKGED
ncbi:MAG: PD-(D/E)XK nuclease family protein [Erysipelotrichales bacterium]|nr:PD-(D/E)XK nuclease family protein [Erysipelotrichales bacterium]